MGDIDIAACRRERRGSVGRGAGAHDHFRRASMKKRKIRRRWRFVVWVGKRGRRTSPVNGEGKLRSLPSRRVSASAMRKTTSELQKLRAVGVAGGSFS